jgi:hypothetical protein
MRIRRPRQSIVIIWIAFIALIFVGLGLVVGDVAGGPIVMGVGAIGNVATGMYIFFTVPRSER